MLKFIRFSLCYCLLGMGGFLWGQLPPNQPEQDCFNAIPLCQDTYFQPNSYRGAGRNTDEIDGNFSCLQLGEQNSVWYTFQVETAGSLCFTIIPVDSTDDYDWAVFNLTNASCAAIANNPSLEAACNFTFNTGCAGETGPNGRIDCPEQFEPCLQVQVGDIYALNVSNFTSSNAGYTIDFSSSTAALYDQIPPELTAVESFCTGVRVTFSERIACASVDPGDFVFTGPDGPYSISSVSSPDCNDSTGSSRQFDLFLAPGIQQAGNYTLSLTGYVGDLCGNGALVRDLPVYMPLPPTASMNPQGPQCQSTNLFSFAYTGPSTIGTYQWNFGDGAFSRQPSPTYHYQVHGTMPVELVITDDNGCSDTARQDITVLPSPNAAFFLPERQCEGDEVVFSNVSGPRGGSAIVGYDWQLTDGSAYFERNPVHVFDRPGRFFVTLTVANDLGCIDTAQRAVAVNRKPQVAFDLPDDLCLGETANFAYRSSASPDSVVGWSWNLGDGSSLGSELFPAHRYATGGVFPVTLTVSTDQGCTDSLTQFQEVFDPPPPSVIGDSVCEGDRAQLDAFPMLGAINNWYLDSLGGEPFFNNVRL
ncbi:MAG: PKD domain-containing protein, partial [Bacteroidota bacterium]